MKKLAAPPIEVVNKNAKAAPIFGVDWQNVSLPIETLEPFERNPRHLTKKGRQQLINSFNTLGMAACILVDPQGLVIDGHARLTVLREDFKYSGNIEVRQAQRKLTFQEYRHALIYMNGEYQKWDMDTLANDYDLAELRELPFPESLLPPPIETPVDLPPEVESTATDDENASWQVVIECRSAQEQTALMTKLVGYGLRPKAVKV